MQSFCVELFSSFYERYWNAPEMLGVSIDNQQFEAVLPLIHSIKVWPER
jgi:hypothetical protein